MYYSINDLNVLVGLFGVIGLAVSSSDKLTAEEKFAAQRKEIDAKNPKRTTTAKKLSIQDLYGTYDDVTRRYITENADFISNAPNGFDKAISVRIAVEDLNVLQDEIDIENIAKLFGIYNDTNIYIQLYHLQTEKNADVEVYASFGIDFRDIPIEKDH